MESRMVTVVFALFSLILSYDIDKIEEREWMERCLKTKYKLCLLMHIAQQAGAVLRLSIVDVLG